MKNYFYDCSKSYSDVRNLDFRNKIWDFLCRDESVIRIITAVDYHRPSTQLISIYLKTFLDDLKIDIEVWKRNNLKEFHRFKMMVGNMIKNILVEHNYKSTKVAKYKDIAKIFSGSSKYKKKK